MDFGLRVDLCLASVPLICITSADKPAFWALSKATFAVPPSQPALSKATFAVLTPQLALSKATFAVLTSLGRRFGAIFGLF